MMEGILGESGIGGVSVFYLGGCIGNLCIVCCHG